MIQLTHITFPGLIGHICGAIAQLGERLHGMQEVSGSIPLSSTNYSFQYYSKIPQVSGRSLLSLS